MGHEYLSWCPLSLLQEGQRRQLGGGSDQVKTTVSCEVLAEAWRHFLVRWVDCPIVAMVWKFATEFKIVIKYYINVRMSGALPKTTLGKLMVISAATRVNGVDRGRSLFEPGLAMRFVHKHRNTLSAGVRDCQYAVSRLKVWNYARIWKFESDISLPSCSVRLEPRSMLEYFGEFSALPLPPNSQTENVSL